MSQPFSRASVVRHSRGIEGVKAVSLFALMTTVAFITDENKWYLLSWLTDEPDSIYKY